MEYFNKDEFAELCAQYGKNAVIKEDFDVYKNESFFNSFQYNICQDRRGEVVFFLQRGNGKFVLIRSKNYSKGLYRAPTGGVGFSEKVIDALSREVKEELGVDYEICAFLGVMRQHISFKNQKLVFNSYVFHLREISGNLIADATSDEVEEYIEADKNTILEIVNNLKNSKGSMRDWASFRSHTTGFILDFI